MPELEHRVTLYVRKACDDKLMTEKQAKKWVEKHFVGCDYGDVRVADVLNIEVKKGKSRQVT